MSEQYDDLDAYIAKRAAKNPAFPKMVDAALKERRLLRKLAARRIEMGLSQKVVAALMGTKQPALPLLSKVRFVLPEEPLPLFVDPLPPPLVALAPLPMPLTEPMAPSAPSTSLAV